MLFGRGRIFDEKVTEECCFDVTKVGDGLLFACQCVIRIPLLALVSMSNGPDTLPPAAESERALTQHREDFTC